MNNSDAYYNELINLMNSNSDSLVIQNTEGINGEIVLHFNKQATEEELATLSEKIGRGIPKDYEEFLRITNGCRLFGEENDLYSVDTVIEQKIITDSTYEKPELLNVACILQDYIFVDLKKVASGSSEYMHVIDMYSPLEYMRSLNCDFKTWLDRLIESKGNKYWE
ncbi:SMI1/KNR4 family protein [Paenibacillus lautus]|uniref:SMI1/KNR4 family protein n=1 Tax=Paenibacillus lautus TaxID=1401 RepID=UPI003D267C8C